MLNKHTPPVAIVGAGLAGLVAAHELRRQNIPVVIFEAGKQVAGLAQSFRDDEGFTYDIGAHFITNRLAQALGVAAQCRTVRRYGESVLLGAQTYTYPLGLLRSPRYLFSAIAAHSGRRTATRPPRTAAEWFRAEYGERLADEIAIPLVEAWSGAPATALSAAVGTKIPGGVAHSAWLKAVSWLTRRAIANGYCREQPESVRVWHVYPEGGVSLLCEHLAADLKDVIHLESPVNAIIVDGDRAVGVRSNGKDHEAAAVISTAPVHILGKLVQGTLALSHLTRFRYRPMTFINLRLMGRGLLPDVVTWTPEPQYPFFRLTEATGSMPWLAPPGKTMITVDIGCDVGDDIWTMPDDQLGAFCVEYMEPIVRDIRQRYLGCHVVRTPIAYPIFLTEYEEERQRFAQSTGVDGLYSIGRNGEFAHILMEDVYWRTRARIGTMTKTMSLGPGSATAVAGSA